MPATRRPRKRFLTVYPDAGGGESTPEDFRNGGNTRRIAPYPGFDQWGAVTHLIRQIPVVSV
jgi:hypothetical protein